MRYLLTFMLGAAAGGLAVFLLLREAGAAQPIVVATKTPEPQAAPASSGPKTEEEKLAASVGIVIAPATAPMEQTIAAEPPMKEIPPLEIPATFQPDAIVIPVVGVERSELRDMFRERRGSREHRAIDIPAPRGTPIVAAIDGPVGKLFLSKPGGITLYQYDPSKAWIYYYAHLDAYAPGIVEGKELKRGEVLGFVGTTGNAPPNAPHLHFAIEKLTEPGRWWKSEPIDPYPLLSTRGVTIDRLP